MRSKKSEKVQNRVTNSLAGNKADRLAQKSYSEKMLGILGDFDIWIRVWRSGLGEVRVYINIGQPLDKNSVEIARYYKTGNVKVAPKTMLESSWLQSKDNDTKNACKLLCDEIAVYWKATKFSCRQAVKA
ncbi:hypothetical protein [Runella sp.]|uniref:hypothetical protein n=1 Tax=Runella sp. TaxID=1960881 RepID=UPI003D111B91